MDVYASTTDNKNATNASDAICNTNATNATTNATTNASNATCNASNASNAPDASTCEYDFSALFAKIQCARHIMQLSQPVHDAAAGLVMLSKEWVQYDSDEDHTA